MLVRPFADRNLVMPFFGSNVKYFHWTQPNDSNDIVLMVLLTKLGSAKKLRALELMFSDSFYVAIWRLKTYVENV